jgi:hypothetical protein
MPVCKAAANQCHNLVYKAHQTPLPKAINGSEVEALGHKHSLFYAMSK